jgi:CTP synthase (UTP-ammonia lyase)
MLLTEKQLRKALEDVQKMSPQEVVDAFDQMESTAELEGMVQLLNAMPQPLQGKVATLLERKMVSSLRQRFKTVADRKNALEQNTVVFAVSSPKEQQAFIVEMQRVFEVYNAVAKIRGDKAHLMIKNRVEAVSELTDEQYNDARTIASIVINGKVTPAPTSKRKLTPNPFRPKGPGM